MDPLIKIKNLSISYYTYTGEVQAVRDISFNIPAKKTVALVGESGCGKSVTAKSILGLISYPGQEKEGSQILYKNRNILDFKEKELNDFRGNGCSMVFQDALVSLNPTMNIGKQIMENLENHTNISKKERVEQAIFILKKVGIADAELTMKKYPHELSGGMRQRVMIAMALVTKPELLIADEPTTALDVTIQAQVLELMKELQKEIGMSILLITHDMGIVADMADEIIVMYAGKIVEKGLCKEIFYHPMHPYTWALLNSIPRIEANKEQQLITIEGNIPDLTCPPKGCAFYERCPYAMNICNVQQPPTVKITDSHAVSCWLTDERADCTDLPFMLGGNTGE